MAFEDHKDFIQSKIDGRQPGDEFTLSQLIGNGWPLGEQENKFGTWFREEIRKGTFRRIADIGIPPGKKFNVHYRRTE